MLKRSINLTFHGIGKLERSPDPGEQEVWISREQFLSLLDGVVDRHDVAITFDDGNASDVEYALPALRARGLKATFFVVAGRLGTTGFLNEDALRELTASGMEIGCHGMRHRPWRGLDKRELHEELREAKDILESAIARPITRAACPFGAYDRRVLRALRGSGYLQVYTSDRGTAGPRDFLQVRNTVRPDDDPGLYERIVALESRTPEVLGRRARLAVKRWR